MEMHTKPVSLIKVPKVVPTEAIDSPASENYIPHSGSESVASSMRDFPAEEGHGPLMEAILDTPSHPPVLEAPETTPVASNAHRGRRLLIGGLITAVVGGGVAAVVAATSGGSGGAAPKATGPRVPGQDPGEHGVKANPNATLSPTALSTYFMKELTFQDNFRNCTGTPATTAEMKQHADELWSTFTPKLRNILGGLASWEGRFATISPLFQDGSQAITKTAEQETAAATSHAPVSARIYLSGKDTDYFLTMSELYDPASQSWKVDEFITSPIHDQSLVDDSVQCYDGHNNR